MGEGCKRHVLLWVVLTFLLYGAAPAVNGASVGGRVWEDTNQNGLQDEGEGGYAGVRVVLLDASADTAAADTTDSDGYYLFPERPAGQYQVQFLLPDYLYFTASRQGDDPELDSDADPASGVTDPFTLSEEESLLSLDAGVEKKKVSDLSIAMSASENFILIGRPLFFTLRVDNHGPDPAAKFSVIDNLSPYLDLVNAQPEPRSAPYPLIWEETDLAPGDSMIFTLEVAVIELGALQNLAFVSTFNFDPNLDDNFAAVEVHILIPVELKSFDARSSEGAVHLTWITATETENLGFYIYRAEGEHNVPLRITSELIPGAGNSESERFYSYVDRTAQSGVSYKYMLASVDYRGEERIHEPVRVTVQPPTDYTLEQNYPNPFNNKTLISYRLREPGFVLMNLFNLKGQKIRTLIAARKNAGLHQTTWDGRDDANTTVASGTYVITLSVNGFECFRTLSFLK